MGVGVGQGKVLTPLHWVAEQGGRHWIAFLEVHGTWWKVDSARVQIVQSDPFDDQVNPMLGANGFTLDVLLFGQ